MSKRSIQAFSLHADSFHADSFHTVTSQTPTMDDNPEAPAAEDPAVALAQQQGIIPANRRRPVRRRPTLAQQYRPCLVSLMSHKDDTEYDRHRHFNQEELLTITPRDIVRWMNLRAYGTEEPGPDDKPTGRRSSGLGFAKKAVSWFMPNRNAHWNVESGWGNPTKSVAVNDLIKAVKKAEVRKQGKKSNAKRDLKRAEFLKTVELLERSNATDFHRRHKVPCMNKFQFHIIGRADDICQIETEDLREHEKFKAFALQTAVSWSKNVLEERDCPDQILLGANDPKFCVLLALACYLETRFTHQVEPGSEEARYLFGEGGDEDEPLRANDRY